MKLIGSKPAVKSFSARGRNALGGDALLTPWILVLLLGAGGGIPRNVMGDIFTEMSSAESDPQDHSRDTALMSSPTHLRARIVTVDSTKLLDLVDAGCGRMQGGCAVTLNLFDDAIFAATVDNVAVSVNGYSFTGRLNGRARGRFNLVVHDNVLVGTVRDGSNATYHVRYLGDGKHVVRQIDPAAFGRCGVTPQSMQGFRNLLQVGPAGDESDGRGMSSAVPANDSIDDGRVHDILVLYSDVTREAGGGTNAIRAEIQLAIDAANAAYADSGIVSRLRLVHMDEVSYDEDTGWDGYLDHLVRLWDPADGYFDQTHELRDRFGADLVTLIVEDTDPDFYGNLTCGLAPVMQEMSADFQTDSFSVVSRECSSDNWTLAHEVGHNQGCAHDRDNAGVDGVFTHSYGHHFVGGTRGWGTIMSYDDAENTWQRIGQFSNANLSHDGAATGVPIGSTGEADNVATINTTRTTVARFRITRYWVDLDWSGAENGLFDTPFNGFLEGLDAVPDGGMVVVKSGGFVSGARILSKQLKINSWNGSTVIGAASP